MVRGVSISIRRVDDRPTLKVVFIAESSVEAIRNDEVLSATLCHILKVSRCIANNQFGTAARPKIEMRYTFIDILPTTPYHLFSYLYTKILIREVARKASGEMRPRV